MAMCEYAWTSFFDNSKIFKCKPQDKFRFHPTQKPVELYKWILKNYAKKGDKILDTHLGSGSSRIAAYDMGFDFIGIEIDKEYFEKNYMAFADEIDKMQEEYMKKVANATRKEIVTGHAAFGYLCRDLGISQESVEDVFASGEPSAQKLAELTDFCKAHNVKVIFTEDLVSPAVSETLAKEAGAKAEAIHTIESAEDGMTYLARMKDNLNKIAEALM